MRFNIGILLILAMIFAFGCSSGKNTPTTPRNLVAGDELASVFDSENLSGLNDTNSKNSIAFAGQLVANGSGGFDLVEDRTTYANYNITGFVTKAHAFHYKIIQWAGNTAEIDVTLDNPTSLAVYDVRLVFNNLGSNKILNPDSYTLQFSRVKSPYIAFAKEDMWRQFPIGPGVSDTRKVFLQLNGGPIGFIIMVSLPEWCEEPYEISNINCIGTLNDDTGGEADISCKVADHVWNLEYVAADLRIFTGSISYMVPNPEQPDNFEVIFSNTKLAHGGKYITWIASKSANSTDLCYNNIEVTIEGGLEPPVVTITTPSVDPYETADRFTTVAGTVTNFDGSPFSGTEAKIDVNGDEQTIPVDNGTFNNVVVLNVGENFVKVSAENSDGIASDSVTIKSTAQSANLWIRLTWDKDYADVDLYVTEPSGETCWYSHKQSNGTHAKIDVDDVDGYGPEHYYLSTAEGHTLLLGVYEIDVHYYDRHEQTEPVLATVLVYKADEYYGEWSHIMAHDNYLEKGPQNRRTGKQSWWDNVANITMP